MRTDFPAGLLANMRSETPTLALLWRVEKNDGSHVLGTDHDDDIELDTSSGEAEGIYYATSNVVGSQLRSTTDLSVDNMEVGGATPSPQIGSPPTVSYDVDEHDIEAGFFQGASVYVYLVNWQSPATDFALIKRGYLGEISRDSEGKYSAEMRGMSQLLQQVFVRTFGERCEVDDFGDHECKVNVDALQREGVVTSITNRRRFNTTITTTGQEILGDWFSLGTIVFTSGDNLDIVREIRSDFEDDVFGHVATWDTFPNDVQIGDTFIIKPGCDRLYPTCMDKWHNIKNFRGYGVFVEGIDAIQKGPV